MLHQKLGVEGGALFGIGLNALRLQQQNGALQRPAESAVGFVYGGRHHHGLFLLEGGSGGGFVGMETGGQLAVGLFQRGGVEVELRWQVEKLEFAGHVCAFR